MNFLILYFYIHRYLYISILREPVRRFHSEWLRFVEKRGPRPSRLLCGGREHLLPDVRDCFEGKDPASVTLEEFASCTDNLALNRQTRMLADLRLVNCYDTSMNQVSYYNVKKYMRSYSTIVLVLLLGIFILTPLFSFPDAYLISNPVFTSFFYKG